MLKNTLLAGNYVLCDAIMYFKIEWVLYNVIFKMWLHLKKRICPLRFPEVAVSDKRLKK